MKDAQVADCQIVSSIDLWCIVFQEAFVDYELELLSSVIFLPLNAPKGCAM